MLANWGHRERKATFQATIKPVSTDNPRSLFCHRWSVKDSAVTCLMAMMARRDSSATLHWRLSSYQSRISMNQENGFEGLLGPRYSPRDFRIKVSAVLR
jgi:hypothetical protein